MTDFQVVFADETATCMTVWGDDLGRAVRLARIAYESRKRCSPPDIVAVCRVQPEEKTVAILRGFDLKLALIFAGELDNEPSFRESREPPR
jgi:hypothetical protein